MGLVSNMFGARSTTATGGKGATVGEESPPRRNAATDWDFPFPAPGRPRSAANGVPARTTRRWPFHPIEDAPLPVRSVPAPVSLDEFRRVVGEWADDVAVISINDPAIAHELEEIRYVYPHATSLVCLISEENKAAMQSRYLPSANTELYNCEEHLFDMGRRTVKYLNTLGGEGLTTTVGWPQDVAQRWADKIWPLSHKLVAQAAGLGVVGLSRNFLHRKFGAYCLIDTVVTNIEWPAEQYATPQAWNPCLNCNLCVASCPTDAIKSDGEFDFFACYNHTYRDSIPGFMDLIRDLGEAKPRKFRKRWSDQEIAALWQALGFKVQYRCFNCVATCPAEIHGPFHADKAVRRAYREETLKPLTHTRRVAEEQFVIDTPGARRKHDIPPGAWRTPPDRARPGAHGVRLVPLGRLRTQSVDAMMRWMPQYFRSDEAKGLEFTTQFTLTGPGGGEWAMRIAGQRCEVRPGTCDAPDLTIRTRATLMLAIHRGEAGPVWAMLTGRLKLSGQRVLFLAFPRLFPTASADGLLARILFMVKRLLRTRRAA